MGYIRFHITIVKSLLDFLKKEAELNNRSVSGEISYRCRNFKEPEKDEKK